MSFAPRAPTSGVDSVGTSGNGGQRGSYDFASWRTDGFGLVRSGNELQGTVGGVAGTISMTPVYGTDVKATFTSATGVEHKLSLSERADLRKAIVRELEGRTDVDKEKLERARAWLSATRMTLGRVDDPRMMQGQVFSTGISEDGTYAQLKFSLQPEVSMDAFSFSSTTHKIHFYGGGGYSMCFDRGVPAGASVEVSFTPAYTTDVITFTLTKV